MSNYLIIAIAFFFVTALTVLIMIVIGLFRTQSMSWFKLQLSSFCLLYPTTSFFALKEGQQKTIQVLLLKKLNRITYSVRKHLKIVREI